MKDEARLSNAYKAELLNGRDDAFELIWNHNKEIGRDLSDDELKNGIKKFLSLGDAIGIIEQKKLIAFAVLYCRHYESLIAYICNVYVLPEYRGNSLSGLLLEKAFEIALNKGFKSIQLHVNEDNRPAITVYTRYGFVPTGNIKKENGEKEIEMIAECVGTVKG